MNSAQWFVLFYLLAGAWTALMFAPEALGLAIGAAFVGLFWPVFAAARAFSRTRKRRHAKR